MTGTWMWRWRYSGSASMSWIEVRRKDGKTEGRKVKLLSVLVLSVFPSFRPSVLSAQREPVLKQIHVPHSYYYREMYLPQATSGPSAAAAPPAARPPPPPRPPRRRLAARWGGARLFDAGPALAPAARRDGGGAAHRRPRLRLPARLVARREVSRLFELP